MKRYFIAFLLLILPALASTQDLYAPNTQAPTQVPALNALTWQDCVQLAAQNNPALLSSMAALESSQSQYKGSFNGILPKLSLSNSYADSFASGIGESKAWTAEGNASLDLIDFGQWATIELALATLKQSQASLSLASANTLLNLYQSFASLLYAQEEVRVDTAIRDSWKTNADMVALRYASGTESKGDNMNTQAQLLQAELNLVQSGRDVEVAQQQLGQSLGKDEFSVLVVTGTWDAPPVPMPHPDFDKLTENEPQVLVQEAVLQQARAGIKSAHSTLWPTLSLNYSKGTEGTTEFPTSPFWTFGGAVNYPLFGNGLTSTYYASQAAQRTYDKALQDMRSIRNQARTSLETAWSGYAKAQDQVKIQRALLDAAWQQEQEYTVLYQGGLETYQQWILIVQSYVNDEISYLQAEQSLIDAEAQWRFAVGEKLGD